MIMPRILGIDYGTKKIGFALSDDGEKIAFPKTVQPNIWDYVENQIRSYIQDESVSEIVVGLPVGLDGKETGLSEEVRQFTAKLKEIFRLPIHLENEVYSSAGVRTSGGAPEHKIDSSSAALILQTYLDRRQGQKSA
ncbi:MAG: Holliday junction resolvase RuvX [Candidatus Niyogibacteria bacterium]|nr:Holliday junction resolvase RuvX [Candidatus Niyogibacteria bacterium]